MATARGEETRTNIECGKRRYGLKGKCDTSGRVTEPVMFISEALSLITLAKHQILPCI